MIFLIVTGSAATSIDFQALTDSQEYIDCRGSPLFHVRRATLSQ